jgi:hypothetical protein
LDEPRGFEIIRIDDIVKEYIPLGSSKEQAIETLKSQGFEVTEARKNSEDNDFDQSEDSILLGIYGCRKSLSILPDYRVVLKIGLQNKIVNVIDAGYVTFKEGE